MAPVPVTQERADEMLPDDPKEIVSRGYDVIGEQYVTWSSRETDGPRERYLALLEERLPPGSQILELGCGTGALTTTRLATRFAVTGVDISPRSLEVGRRRVPDATFVQADMTRLELPPASVDAVTAFYSMTHVPREEHPGLLGKIARWLRPGGLLVATMGAGSVAGDIEDDWLGVPMFFSHFDADENERLVRQAGFTVSSARVETTDEDGVPVAFLWVVAEAPR